MLEIFFIYLVYKKTINYEKNFNNIPNDIYSTVQLKCSTMD